MNSDGLLDLLTANGNHTAGIMLGQGDGTFGAAKAFPTGSSTATAIKVGDLNLDGRPDVIVTSLGTGTLLLGLPDGTLTLPMAQFTLSMTDNPNALALGDVNGDGRLDVVTAFGMRSTSGDVDEVTVVISREGNVFLPAVAYPLPARCRPEGVALGDVNQDGRLDIATANWDGRTVGLLLGRGDGTFAPATTLPVEAGPLGVIIADVNGDQLADLVTANNATGTVSVLLGSGAGAFLAAVTYPVGAHPVGIVVGDVNQDGAVDVVTAGFGDNELSVLPGRGNGTFGSAEHYATEANSGPISTAIGDVNEDRAPDLVSANFTAGTVSVFLSQVPVLALNGPLAAGTGAPLLLSGSRLAGATQVSFTSTTQLVTAVPATSFTSTNYTSTPNTIGLEVPASLLPGSYQLAITTPRGNSPTTNFTVTTPLTSVSPTSAARGQVYPNPAHALTTVHVPAQADVNAVQLCLRDALGRPLRQVEAPLGATGLAHPLSLHGLAPGLYLLQVQAGKQRTTHRLVIE